MVGSNPAAPTNMSNKVKIESIAFSMWSDKHKYIRGPQGQWLAYWELYDIWLTHETRQTYIDHVERSIKNWKVNRQEPALPAKESGG